MSKVSDPAGRRQRPAATRPDRRPRRQPAARPAVPRLIALNKPFDVLTQFTDDQGRATLRDFVDIPGIYAAGRLDRDSEGLLLLTNDGRLQARSTDPRHKLAKTYWVQVEGEPTAEQLAQLRAGPLLNDGPTRPAELNRWPSRPCGPAIHQCAFARAFPPAGWRSPYAKGVIAR